MERTQAPLGERGLDARDAGPAQLVGQRAILRRGIAGDLAPAEVDVRGIRIEHDPEPVGPQVGDLTDVLEAGQHVAVDRDGARAHP